MREGSLGCKDLLILYRIKWRPRPQENPRSREVRNAIN